MRSGISSRRKWRISVNLSEVRESDQPIFDRLEGRKYPTHKKRAGGVAGAITAPSSKRKALSSNFSAAKKNKTKTSRHKDCGRSTHCYA
jgi:hypothetical protein